MSRLLKLLILFGLLGIVSWFVYRTYVSPLLQEFEYATVVATQYQNEVVATGNVEARSDVLLAFEVTGTVQEVLYKPGDVAQVGSLIASLNASTLQAEVQQQRARLERETLRLKSFIAGPEKRERERISADTQVSEQSLENEARIALVSAQQAASGIETLVRKDVDVFFTGLPDNPRLDQFQALSTGKQNEINKLRLNLESVFDRWRTWSNINIASNERTLGILEQFEKDLRAVNSATLAIYDILLKQREDTEETNTAFLTIAAGRQEIFKVLVGTTQDINKLKTAAAQHNLTLIKAKEDLDGSTVAQRSQQQAVVDAEQERLRQTELELAKTEVRAPFTGVVGEVFFSPGEFVTAGGNAVRFISEGGFDLSVDVTEVEVRHITLNQEMRARLESTGEDITVRVRTVDATEKLLSGVPVYTVVLDVVDSTAVLRPGLTVDIFIPIGKQEQVLALPAKAVSGESDSKSIIIERGGQRLAVPIQLGSTLDDGLVAVEGALREGDTVIIVKE